MQSASSKILLAIETSCDETAAAVLSLERQPAVFSPTRPAQRGSSFSLTMPRSLAKLDALGATSWPKIRTLSSVVKSQIQLHSKYGGVVPEAAARAHVKNIRPVVEKTIDNSRLTINDIDYIAVTVGPGLVPSLIVGVEFAKGLSFALKKPIIPVNHMLGHLYSPFGGEKYQISNIKYQNIFPMISLIVSGGHTMLVLVKNIKDYKVIGETVDDAAGEAFDKVAKLLGLPYPGGPEVSKLALKAKHPVTFPRPMIHAKNYNFSFAGLKTAVLYYTRAKGQGLRAKSGLLSPTTLALSAKADICAGFQTAAVDVLVTKTLRAADEYRAKCISLSGGVAANSLLRQQLIVNCKSLKVKFMAPPMNLCTDNAEMIGLAACFMLHNGYKPKTYRQIKANPNLEL